MNLNSKHERLWLEMVIEVLHVNLNSWRWPRGSLAEPSGNRIRGSETANCNGSNLCSHVARLPLSTRHICFELVSVTSAVDAKNVSVQGRLGSHTINLCLMILRQREERTNCIHRTSDSSFYFLSIVHERAKCTKRENDPG